MFTTDFNSHTREGVTKYFAKVIGTDDQFQLTHP